MRLGTTAALALGFIALIVGLVALAQVHRLATHELACTYRTYINATCTHGKCVFDIAAEPNKWYKVIEVTCRGEGTLALYLVTDEYTSVKIVGSNNVILYMTTNESAILPVTKTVTYEFYVRTTAPIGETSGTLLIAEIS